MHVSWQLHVKTWNVWYHMLQHEISIVAYMGKMALSGAPSPMGRKMSYLRNNFDIWFTDSLSQYINMPQICFGYQATVKYVKLLFSCVQGETCIDRFYYEMLNNLLTNLCID